MQSLRLEWPDFVLEYYDAQDKVGSTTEIALNLDCIVDRNSTKPVYANLIAISVLPLILSFLAVVMWTLWTMIKNRMKPGAWSTYTLNIKGTLINILFLLHPTILKVSM